MKDIIVYTVRTFNHRIFSFLASGSVLSAVDLSSFLALTVTSVFTFNLALADWRTNEKGWNLSREGWVNEGHKRH